MDLFKKARIAELQVGIFGLEQELAEERRQAQALIEHGRRQAAAVPGYFEGLLAENAGQAQEAVAGLALPVGAGWGDERWAGWAVGGVVEEPRLRVGSAGETRGGASLTLPVFVPFIGRNRTVVIRTDERNAERGAALLQSLALRAALLLPYRARYTLLDPGGAGRAFAVRHYLPQVREGSGDTRRDLDAVMADIQRVVGTYLDDRTTSFEQVPEEIRSHEPFQLVFAADFPNGYDRRAIEALQSVGKTGPGAGVYLFVHYNRQHELPRDLSMEGFGNASYVDLTGEDTPSVRGLSFRPDGLPEAEVQKRAFAALEAYEPKDRVIDWERVAGLAEEAWWQARTDTAIETPIGARGRGEPLKLWLGVEDGRPCSHGLVGAMAGAGRSNLFDVLIAGLAVRYGPDELRLYLIDGKRGRDFEPYRRLPHVEVVSLHSSPELSRSVLAELVDELDRRAEIFTRAGERDLAGYRGRGQPEGALPRILLLVDDYQELFEHDREGLASSYLLELSEKGGAAGINLLLASQAFNAAGILNRAGIFGNLHLRVAMQMAASDREALTEFGRRGRALIAGCNRPGEIVLNDRAGDDADGANQAGKVAFLRPERRDELLSALAARAESLPEASLGRRIVLDGRAQPALVDNPFVVALAGRESWPTADELQALARASIGERGFGVADWFSAEHPRVAWLGRQFDLHGHARLVFRRRTGEHALIVGGANPERYGMLAAIVASTALNAGPDEHRYVLVDRSVPGTAWSDVLRQVQELVLGPAGFPTVFARESDEVEPLVGELVAELDRRRRLNERELALEPSVFVAMTELDRVDSLRRRAGSYGLADTPAGERLARLYVEGSPFGIHLVLAFGGLRPMIHLIDDRRGLIHFGHRVALQMSDDDSHIFVRSRRAALLQVDGPKPVCALYLDVEADRAVRFQPYSCDSAGPPLVEQLRTIGAALARRVARPAEATAP